MGGRPPGLPSEINESSTSLFDQYLPCLACQEVGPRRCIIHLEHISDSHLRENMFGL